ncbi:hypothetical protein HDU91_003882 [Kappamyces sp. JEL0680]|nr:hypothetical protein HDU91_003882 [Kappamyces sp. JEL0680]
MQGSKYVVMDALKDIPHTSHFSFEQAIDAIHQVCQNGVGFFTGMMHLFDHDVIYQEFIKKGKQKDGVDIHVAQVAKTGSYAQAAPAPPVGPALGQKGVKSIDFCKQFNDRTKNYVQGVPISARITVNPDKTFTFITKSPPTSWFLKQALNIDKGSSRPGDIVVGTLSLKHLYHIAQAKQKDPGFEGVSLEKITKQVLGTAKNMGIKVVP